MIVVVGPLELFATLAAGLFSGASIYINLVEHPARIHCGTALALAQFAPSYKRATLMQATLAATGFLAALAAYLLGAGTPWLIGGILVGLVIPFTLLSFCPLIAGFSVRPSPRILPKRRDCSIAGENYTRFAAS
jgi:hypothetical protein